MDKRFKEFKTLGSKITEVNKQIAAGTTTLKKGLEGIPEQYQGIVKQVNRRRNRIKKNLGGSIQRWDRIIT